MTSLEPAKVHLSFKTLSVKTTGWVTEDSSDFCYNIESIFINLSKKVITSCMCWCNYSLKTNCSANTVLNLSNTDKRFNFHCLSMWTRKHFLEPICANTVAMLICLSVRESKWFQQTQSPQKHQFGSISRIQDGIRFSAGHTTLCLNSDL